MFILRVILNLVTKYVKNHTKNISCFSIIKNIVDTDDEGLDVTFFWFREERNVWCKIFMICAKSYNLL